MKKWIVDIVSVLLVFLFVYASVSKLVDINGFRADMNNQPFPYFIKPVLLWLLPTSELLVATFLIFNKTRITGLYGALILMTLFTFYTLIVLLDFFPYVPCSCGGVIKNLSWKQHLAFNLFFVMITIIAIFHYPLKNFRSKSENSP